jgi:hypothetical protein
MLKTPAPFPQVGSYALFEDRRDFAQLPEMSLVRIIGLDGPASDEATRAVIAFPLRAGASGNRTVTIGDLIDGTPLTDAERAEIRTLESDMAGKARVAKKVLARYEALRHRDIRSRTLLDQLDEATKRAAA